MHINIEKQHVETYLKIADEVNKAVGLFSHSNYKADPKKYERLLDARNISVEKKKRLLIEHLHKLIVKTFSLHPEKINKKKILDDIKTNVSILRLMVLKLRDINYYLETSFLEELGLIKAPRLKTIAKEHDSIEKRYLENVEHTVYKLIERIISLDSRMLKNYRKREERVIKGEKLEIKDIEKVLKKESDLLSYIEAKLPLISAIRASLLDRRSFTVWSSMVLALQSALENEYGKEQVIFNEIRKNKKAKDKLEIRINHLINEKLDILKVKEKRLLAWEKAEKVEEEHRKAAFDFALASKL